MPDLPGHDRREERRRRRQHRRLIEDGDVFDSTELDDGTAELVRVEPSGREPGTEPWGVREPNDEQRERLRLYREFLAARGEGDGP